MQYSCLDNYVGKTVTVKAQECMTPTTGIVKKQEGNTIKVNGLWWLTYEIINVKS